jgi:hypothetical protein
MLENPYFRPWYGFCKMSSFPYFFRSITMNRKEISKDVSRDLLIFLAMLAAMVAFS